MAIANSEMMKNVLFTTINTKYKEVPPNEEEFLAEANRMRESVSGLYPVTDSEYEEILAYLKATLVIQMDIGVYINDRNQKHQSWLPARRAELDFFFWSRYKRYLEQAKHWNTRVTASLDKVSDEIVDLLGDPASDKGFQIRGLVLGDVQSGKTANYTAICNKAADTGYRIIIVLAGMMENLRKQTQERLDAEFSGRKSEYYLDPKAKQEIKNTAVGVGCYAKGKKIASFTSVTKDFDIGVLRSNDLALGSVSDPVLLVVKKNKSILNNLIQWLKKNNVDSKTGKIMIPMLLIDDEADNASVNTKSEDDNPAAINACIRELLNIFYQASYLGITATPFANIFIDPDSEDEMLGDDLFPKDFIYSLSAPTNYIGAENIFGGGYNSGNVLKELSFDEIDRFFPFKHKKDLPVEELPPSLDEAIAYFLLINAIRDVRGDNTEHRSMMVHVSRFTDVQDRLAALINERVLQIRTDLKSYSQLSADKAEQISNIRYLRKVWEKHNLFATCSVSWDEILKDYLYQAVAPMDVRAVNQKTGAASLDYFNHKNDGLRVIAVGGNSLSRGLTLEGLCVSYFYRKSQMYDTLLQMGRWFGYRPNYEDLFKIWMAKEAIDWYGYITEAANGLKSELAKMKAANQTPMDFGLKVRQDPNSLIVTARNKMRTATSVTIPVTVSGKLLETPRLKVDSGILETNARAFKQFVDCLSVIGRLDETLKQYYWHEVPKSAIAQLLRDFETHPWHLTFQGRALADYIEDKMDDAKWDVALVFDGDGESYAEGLKYGNSRLLINTTERRKVIADEKMIRISGTKVRVGSGGCTRVGLSDEQEGIAKKRFQEQEGKKNKGMSDNAYLIKERAPLLMLHIIQVDLDEKDSTNKDVPPFLFALGVGFPYTGAKSKTANYVVNLVELKNWMDPDEGEDE